VLWKFHFFKYFLLIILEPETGHVGALAMPHMNGLNPIERTIEQRIETIAPSSKTITASAWRQIELKAYESCYTTIRDSPSPWDL